MATDQYQRFIDDRAEQSDVRTNSDLSMSAFSGFRPGFESIVAADDPAGLIVSERLRSEMKGSYSGRSTTPNVLVR